MRRAPDSLLWVMFIVLCDFVFIRPISKPTTRSDSFPQLTQRCRTMHLRYRIWCYSSGDCYGIAWPEKYDFFDSNKVSSWTERANTKQAVAESLASALESCPNKPPNDSKTVYDSGTRP